MEIAFCKDLSVAEHIKGLAKVLPFRMSEDVTNEFILLGVLMFIVLDGRLTRYSP
jgi:hypothetical protein